MKKKTNKVLTKTLYSYVTPEARAFALKKAKRDAVPGGYSGYVNDLILADQAKEAKRAA